MTINRKRLILNEFDKLIKCKDQFDKILIERLKTTSNNIKLIAKSLVSNEERIKMNEQRMQILEGNFSNATSKTNCFQSGKILNEVNILKEQVESLTKKLANLISKGEKS